MTRWMLVFEDPESETVWLGKAVPREWLSEGKTTAVSGAPTRWGHISFSITSHLNTGTVTAELKLPSDYLAVTKLRLRVPGETRIKTVSLNGKPWSQFDALEETVTIPAGMSGIIKVQAQYN
jgi:hypothetical protein